MNLDQCISAALSASLLIVAFFLKRILSKMDDAVDSINKLNTNMAVVMSKGKDYNLRIKECEDRLHNHGNEITALKAINGTRTQRNC